MLRQSNKKFIIVGAGPSGVTAHEELLKRGIKPEDILHLEIENYIGGKCKTFQDPKNPGLVTDMGAHWMITNYTEVIEASRKYGVTLETVLDKHSNGIPFADEFAKKSTFEKLKMLPSLLIQTQKYVACATEYMERQNSTSDKPLPEEYRLSFAEFAKNHDMEHMIGFLQAVVTGFGYGSMNEIKAYQVFDYLGKTAPTDIIINQLNLGHSMLGIQGGYQHLIETFAANHEIITSAKISRIERTIGNVKVTYTKDGETQMVTADTLIIATSPLQWPTLGMELTQLEQECLQGAEYFRYPIAGVRIKGYPPEQYILEKGLLDENFKRKAGEIALITTRDNRTNPEEGRLCTVFQNLTIRNMHSSPVDEQQERDFFLQKLLELANENHWEIGEIVDYKAWNDYMPSLSPELSQALEHAQMNQRTLYCTSALPGGFDIVERSIETAKHAVSTHVFNEKYKPTGAAINAVKMLFFSKPVDPFSDKKWSTNQDDKSTPRSRL